MSVQEPVEDVEEGEEMSTEQETNRSPPEVLQRPNNEHVPWLLREVWNRLNRDNEHFMACIVGEEGSAKSYTAIKIANIVDPTFNEGRVIFDVVELLKALASGDHEPGNFYVLDEAGVQLGVRTWQDRGQVLANQALQLIRSHNLGLIFTVPRLSELDSQAQGRLQALLEMVDKEPGEWAEAKWKRMDPDRTDDTGKIYKKYPRRVQNGQKIRITSLKFTPPSPEITEPYEREKEEFQEQFYEKTIEKLEEVAGDDDDDEDGSADPREIATEIANGKISQYVQRHSQNNTPYINAGLIEVDYELPQRRAKLVKDILSSQFSKTELEDYA